MWWMIDIAVIGILLISIVKGFKSGFASSLVSFAGGLAAVVVALFLSNLATDLVYENALKETIVSEMQEKIEVSFEPAEIYEKTEDVILKATEEMPDFISTKVRELASDSGIVNKIKSTSALTSKNTAEIIEEQIVRPLATFLIRVAAFIVLLMILLVIVKAAAKSLRLINKLPFIGGANKAVGAVFGLLSGLLSAVIFIYILKTAALITENKIPVINDSDISQSITIGYIYNSELPYLLNFETAE